MRARYANLVLGVWLLASAFLWPHGPAQFRNAWSVGALCIVVASLAMALPPVRYANTTLGAWLFVSTLFLPGLTNATAVNNLLVAVVVMVFSLMPRARGIPSPDEPKPRAPRDRTLSSI